MHVEAAPRPGRADLLGHQPREVGGAAFEQVGGLEQQRAALARAGLRPGSGKRARRPRRPCRRPRRRPPPPRWRPFRSSDRGAGKSRRSRRRTAAPSMMKSTFMSSPPVGDARLRAHNSEPGQNPRTLALIEASSPPSTGRLAPLIQRAPSEQRNSDRRRDVGRRAGAADARDVFVDPRIAEHLRGIP